MIKHFNFIIFILITCNGMEHVQLPSFAELTKNVAAPVAHPDIQEQQPIPWTQLWPKNFKNHTIRHTMINFQCPYCSYCFPTSQQLKFHQGCQCTKLYMAKILYKKYYPNKNN